MPSPTTMSRSRTYPVDVDDAFARTLALPLEDLFRRRYLALPPIERVDQDGAWTTAGQVRAIHTGDGGEMCEELTSVLAPDEFTYDLRPVSGPMKPLIDRVEGSWRFATVGTGCRITWTWTVHPGSGAAGAIQPVFKRMWQGYAGRALDHLEDLLLAAP